jgi:hypothetical protein
MKKTINTIGQILGISFSIFLLSFVVFAWTGPGEAPPGGNISAPLNTSSESQFKSGALSVGGVFETASLIINPDGASQPTCNTSTRGMIWTESGGEGEQDVMVFCGKHSDGTFEWIEYASMWKGITATGGDSVYTFVGNGSNGISGVTYRVHKFTTTGSSEFNVTDTGTDGEVEYLVVAGGGGGAGSAGSGSGPRGGGGAGGMLTGVISLTGGLYEVVIGAGGAGGVAGGENNGVNGNDSIFGQITTYGGGAGRSYNGTQVGFDGGSGGGSCYTTTKSNGIEGQGNGGGANANGAGGGGGAGGVGLDGSGGGSGGAGGVGLLSTITGVSIYYAGGGGGGGYPSGTANYGEGGLGGGGRGASSGTAVAGTQNTGGGGGAGGSGAGGGSGGSGVVIVRYPITNPN